MRTYGLDENHLKYVDMKGVVGQLRNAPRHLRRNYERIGVDNSPSDGRTLEYSWR